MNRFPKIPRDGAWFDDSEINEQIKIQTELREKYAEELGAASWWKHWLIAIRIHREAARIFRHRLYSST